MAELTDEQRRFLRKDTNGVDEWCSMLIERFKELNAVALAKLTSEKYTIRDTRNRRQPPEYVQAIIRHAKGAGIACTYNQLVFAHQGIATELRVSIDPPTRTTLVADFIQTLIIKKQA